MTNIQHNKSELTNLGTTTREPYVTSILLIPSGCMCRLKVAQTNFNTFKKLSYWNDLHYNTVSRISIVVVPYETAIIAE